MDLNNKLIKKLIKKGYMKDPSMQYVRTAVAKIRSLMNQIVVEIRNKAKQHIKQEVNLEPTQDPSVVYLRDKTLKAFGIPKDFINYSK